MELLAPASNLSTALTAFECGADSVYAGLQKFNARERGDNFDYDSFGELVSFARTKGKKVYLTLNTLLKENELEEVTSLLHIVADIRPHAVIVQDLGLLMMIRECFPQLAIHASTQMAVHNSAGVKLLASLGVERVILERQLTLAEVKATIDDSPIEVEVFGHGALCCSLSGVCLLSSWMGGWSGNRGRCKQPCRRRFHSKKGNGFFFSTRDLSTLDFLTELEAAGAAAIKIEGRLRKEDYVESVVSSYRQMLDTAPRERRKKLGEVKKTLAMSLGRKWSSGFYFHKRPKDVVQHQSLGVAGLLCGQVTKSKSNGFEVNVSRPFSVQDRIRIQPQSGDEGPLITITRMSLGRKSANSVRSGERPFVFCDKEVSVGDRVFLIGRSSKERKLPPDFQERQIVDLCFSLSPQGAKGKLIGSEKVWVSEKMIESAKQHALTKEQIEEELRKGGGDELIAGTVDIEVHGALFLRHKELRQLRQSFWLWVKETFEKEKLTTPGERGKKLADELLAKRAALPKKNIETTVCASSPKKNPIKKTITASYMVGGDELILPDFCPEPDLKKLKGHVLTAYEEGVHRFRVTSLYGLTMLKDFKDVFITVTYPLPVANSMAVKQLTLLGVHSATAWVELDQGALEELVANVDSGLEVYSYGRPHLLSTRANVSVKGPFRDGRGAQFILKEQNGLARVYSGDVLQRDVPKGCSKLIDLRNAELNERNKTQFNDKRLWQ